MRDVFRNNGLSIALFSLFAFAFCGQYLTGLHEFNEDQAEHGRAQVGYVAYLGEGHFIEATFENWESEFLQMAVYVVFTIFLFQKGSSESKEPGKVERVDVIPEESRTDPEAPYPVRKGGWILTLYQNSLSLAFFILFAASFALHAVGGVKEFNLEQAAHGQPAVSLGEFLTGTTFWFQSFQNWQSEFLSIGLMAVLTIYLRQKGSPESKPVDAPHNDTGTA
ncbi:MAG: DUF6766 family protein [Pyrinomonadaceae bacterium]